MDVTWTREAWFLTGPTASGKSSLALDLAERTGAEILAMDSMTLYRGMDIGTAKPTREDQARVPHHLLDLFEPWESASLEVYLRQAQLAAETVRNKGKMPLFVGGTPLYLKALLRGIFDGPPADAELRATLEDIAREKGSKVLYDRLREVDVRAAERIKEGDVRRLVRALEVFEKTGRPISDWQNEFERPADPAPRVACLALATEETYSRIDSRVLEMFEGGWIEETQKLLALPRPLSKQALQAVGYAEIREHLEGRLEKGAIIELIQRRSRQFSKRQRTWFRHLEELRFFQATAVPRETLLSDIEVFFRTGS